MKRIALTIVLALVGLTMSAQLSNLTPRNGVGSDNPGSSNNPYQISTLADLTSLRTALSSGTTALNQPTRGKYFELTADIDISGSNWSPLGANSVQGAFKGTFDGNGYKIIGMTSGSSSTRTASGQWGFFNRADTATIKNVSFTNVSAYISGSGFTLVGGVVATCYATNIVNCSIDGTIDVFIPTSGNIYLGSFVGAIYRGTNIINCSSNMTLNAKSSSTVSEQGVYVGGIVAFENDAVATTGIVNCAAYGSISGIQTNMTATAKGNPLYLGGILGYNTQFGSAFKIINCLAANTIYGEAAVGSLTLLVSGIGNSNDKPGSGVNVSNCISLCPSLQLKIDSVTGCTYYGVKKVWRVAGVPSASAASATNLVNNYSKDDMLLQTGNPLVTRSVTDNLFHGTSLGSNNYLTLLNNYVAANVTYAGIPLTSWSNSGNLITNIVKNTASQIKSTFVNGELRLTGLEYGDKIAIFDVTGKLVWNGVAKDSEISIKLNRGCYIVNVDNAKNKYRTKVI